MLTISHLKFDNNQNVWCFQSNEEHSKGVARLAAFYARKIGFEDWGTTISPPMPNSPPSTPFHSSTS